MLGLPLIKLFQPSFWLVFMSLNVVYACTRKNQLVSSLTQVSKDFPGAFVLFMYSVLCRREHMCFFGLLCSVSMQDRIIRIDQPS